MRYRIAIAWCVFYICCAVPGQVCVRASDSFAVDYAAIRGANYVPSYASTSIGTWTDFQVEAVDRELAFAKRLRLNSVRVFLQYVAYEKNPAEFLQHLEQFVAIAGRHEIRPMFVLFDSCFGKEPMVQDANSEMWVNNPGFSRIASDDWSRLEAYVNDVVTTFAENPQVLMWDIMNEPMADFEHVTRQERNRIWKFCRHFCRFVKTKDPNHTITVGHAVVEYIPKTADLVDVLSIHSYARYEDWLQQDVDLAWNYGRKFGKPVIVTEFGNPGAGQKYEMALDVIERNELGFYFWELMISKVMFKDMAGLIYPDGTVRQLGPVARLLHEKYDSATGEPPVVHDFRQRTKGGIPLKQPRDATPLRVFLSQPDQWRPFVDKSAAAPRTKANITAAIPTLAQLGRYLGRPDPEAQEVFELALSIPHHFRLGREEQAVQDFEKLVRIVSRALKSPNPRFAPGN
ncbi:MAG TPA: cellulase family glycosylhydrolase [Pirellulaceae bacterium]|nr:cellulase family glycosylhydrolase [Pirellulaceae bacterium]